MSPPPLIALGLLAGAGVVIVLGGRGWCEIHAALRNADFDRLISPMHWPAARLLVGAAGALPPWLLASDQGVWVWVAMALAGLAGYAWAPALLASLRQRVERQILDDLPVHFELLAVALESGCSWSAALALCVERTPDSVLRRCWQRLLADLQSGTEALDGLRALEQRLRLTPFATLVSALRAAEKLQLPAAAVLRDRARQSAAARFARAERRARAVPLKLWAALVLCLAPCTGLILAFPLAQWLAALLG